MPHKEVMVAAAKIYKQRKMEEDGQSGSKELDTDTEKEHTVDTSPKKRKVSKKDQKGLMDELQRDD
jgi:hypothetical protein